MSPLQRLIETNMLLHSVWPDDGESTPIFELALMTPFGAAMLATIDSPIVMDATGGVNSIGYPYTALVIKDDAGNGLPVSHLVYGNTKAPATVITQFLRESAEHAGITFEGRIIFVDKDTAEMDGAAVLLMRVFLCWFHYKQGWQKFLNTTASGAFEKLTKFKIQDNLTVIKRCTSINEFKRQVEAFRVLWAHLPLVRIPFFLIVSHGLCNDC
jgi:hypothetical protein